MKNQNPHNCSSIYLIFVCLLVLGCEQTVTGKQYSNPVWEGYLADPAVTRVGDTWYAYGTGGNELTGEQFPILKSQDFLNWSFVGYALNPKEQNLSFSEYWAPEVIERNGRLYLYYAGDLKMRVAVSDNPEGGFEDVGVLLFPDLEFSIDGHPYKDPESGNWYLFYARDFLDEERVGTGMAVARLGDDMVSIQGDSKKVITAFADWQIYQRNRKMYGKVYDWHTVEGPWVVKREKTYYCFYATSNWQTPNYGVGYAVAENPMGPWKDGGNVNGPKVLSGAGNDLTGPGHISIALKPDGKQDFIIYHSWNEEGDKRVMCIDPLEWTDDGPRVIGASFGKKTLND